MPAPHSQVTRYSRVGLVLAATFSVLLANLAGVAFAFDSSDTDIPWDATDGVPDQVGFEIADPCNDQDDTVPNNGNDYKLNNIQTQASDVFHLQKANAKSDLCSVRIDTFLVPADSTSEHAGHLLLYLAWERYGNNGSVKYGMEFHHEEPTCDTLTEQGELTSCNPFADRVDGDFVLVYDFQGSPGDVDDPPFCADDTDPQISLGRQDWEDPNNDKVGSFTTPLSMLPADAFVACVEPEAFSGEAIIDLAAASLPPIIPPIGHGETTECELLAAFIPFTMTGNSPEDTAELIDVALTNEHPGITNCGTLEVTKVVTGGNDFGQDFDIALSNTDGEIHSEGLGHDESYEVVELFAGDDYELEETVPAGWSITGIECSDGSSTDAATLSGIEVVASETTSCTVTNAPDLPTITLEKTAVGENISEDDFQASLNAGDVDWDVATEVAPGSHTIAEAIASGSDVQSSWYESGNWSCDNGDGGTATGATVSVGLGDDVTCTITNTELPSTLTLHKDLTNDEGGNDTQDDFQARIDGDAVDWDQSYEVDALVEHTASEDDPGDGYTPGPWTGDCAADGTVTLDPGEDGECTISNDDNPPMITVLKDVTNDDGGTAGPGDFDLLVDGVSHVHGDDVIVLSNEDVTVGENNLPGYVQTGISCDDGTSVTGTGDVTLNLDEGEHVTCTVSNDDLPASLTLVKTVNNNDGATAVADDFQAYIDGNPVDWSTSVELPAGDHAASEDSLEGYVSGQWAGDCASDGSVSLANGEHLVCTVTNDDLPAEIDVVKNATDGVTDDGEGNLVATLDLTDEDDETVTYTYVVTNTGDVTLENVTLNDDVLGAIDLPQTTLEPGESVTVTAVHTLSEDDPDTIVNVATVTGDPIHGAPTVEDDDDESVSIVQVLPEVLPETGYNSLVLAVVALLMLLVGMTVLGTPRMQAVPVMARVQAMRTLRRAQHTRRRAVSKLTSGHWPNKTRHRW